MDSNHLFFRLHIPSISSFHKMSATRVQDLEVHASGYQVPPSEYTICLPQISISDLRKDSVTNL